MRRPWSSPWRWTWCPLASPGIPTVATSSSPQTGRGAGPSSAWRRTAPGTAPSSGRRDPWPAFSLSEDGSRIAFLLEDEVSPPEIWSARRRIRCPAAHPLQRGAPGGAGPGQAPGVPLPERGTEERPTGSPGACGTGPGGAISLWSSTSRVAPGACGAPVVPRVPDAGGSRLRRSLRELPGKLGLRPRPLVGGAPGLRGADAQDNLQAVDEVLRRWDWVDPDRLFVTGGSHGGFLTNWLTTQTDQFRAAVTQRSVANWISEAGTQAYPPRSMRRGIRGDHLGNYDYYWEPLTPGPRPRG
jgi:hypothetical protein